MEQLDEELTLVVLALKRVLRLSSQPFGSMFLVMLNWPCDEPVIKT